jgi:hypothetical protein
MAPADKSVRGRDAEVSWLGVIASGAFPPERGPSSGLCRGLAADSCGGSAGLAPDFPVASHGYRNTRPMATQRVTAQRVPGSQRGRLAYRYPSIAI